MRRFLFSVVVCFLLAFAVVARSTSTAQTAELAGQQIFRFDTFGDEQLWTNVLRMHEVVPTLTPEAALGVGLQVDSEVLPKAVVRAITRGQVNLKDPAVTALLLKLNAVVGVIGKFDSNGTLTSVGITCALCHSVVDNSVADGIGRRLDGWPNRELKVGSIISLSPALTPEQKTPYLTWLPGFYDPRFRAFDGTQLLQLNETTLPVVIPPAYGLQGVGFETFTGDGPISYWNAYVGIGQMGGHGDFQDLRLPLTIDQPPPDLVTPKLPALLAYQLRLRAPTPPPGSFSRSAANRGEEVFKGVGRCSQCHTGHTYTDVSSGPNPAVPLLHPPGEVGQNPAYALRSATKMYRSTPLRGIWQHPPYFHDGSAANLGAVVDHYDKVFSLGLTAQQRADLIEFLKSL